MLDKFWCMKWSRFFELSAARECRPQDKRGFYHGSVMFWDLDCLWSMVSQCSMSYFHGQPIRWILLVSWARRWRNDKYEVSYVFYFLPSLQLMLGRRIRLIHHMLIDIQHPAWTNPINKTLYSKFASRHHWYFLASFFTPSSCAKSNTPLFIFNHRRTNPVRSGPRHRC